MENTGNVGLFAVHRIARKIHFSYTIWNVLSQKTISRYCPLKKGFAVPTALAELLNCKLLSTVSVAISDLYFMMSLKSPMMGHARTQCYGDQLNDIAR
jgi:hypothetical protein